MTVGDLCDTISNSYRGDDKEVVLINTSDVLEGKVLNHQVVENKNLKGQFKKTFKENDILYSEIRPANKRYAFVDFSDTDNYIASTKLMVLRPRMDVIRPRFLFSFLSSKSVLEELQQLAETRSGTFPQITFSSELAPTPINVPDLETQDRIVGILGVIERKISMNAEINKNLEQQAVLLFKKWFTDFVNTSSNLIETRFGLIPDTFRLLKNGELPIVITDYVANGSFASLKANVTLYQEPNYAYFIRNTDLKSGLFEVFVDKHSYRFLSKSTLYGREIIISNVGDVGSVFLCPKLNKPMTLGNNIIMLRSEQDNLKYYLYIWFKWLYGQSLIQGIKGGSAQPKFNKTDFKNLPIFLPHNDLLEQFHQTVKPMFDLIEKNNEENQALTVIRDTLLPKLMSGELDVSDINI
ncbi:MAG: restriction endonuclease subunit S [Veillonella sp.]|nr:restriction endonuclease subunit S [Veillonella sp.]